MATDSTNLPQGEANLDASTDMAGAELDLAGVQLAQTEPAQPVIVPGAEANVVVVQVRPGQVITLPTDSVAGVFAKFGPEGNLAFLIDGRTIILRGYNQANEQQPVKIVTRDGDPVVPAEVVADTDQTLDIQTAAGGATGPQGDTTDGNGIFIPFTPGDGPGLIGAEGVLGATELAYKNIDDNFEFFAEGEDTSPDFTISFDILGGIVNEDDLLADKEPREVEDEFQAAKLILSDAGANGEGNDPFDTKDNEDQNGVPDDTDGEDINKNGVDDDREPTQTVATVKVDFGPDAPGTLVIDPSLLPGDLKSEGEEVVYAVIAAGGGIGTRIVAYVDDGIDGFEEGKDRLVFDVQVDKDFSDGDFKVTFKLYDNIDNAAPAGLLGAEEQILGLPVKFTVTDSDGSTKDGVLDLGVEDDIPFFGQLDENEDGLTIVQTDADIIHDETHGVQPNSDDVSIFNYYVAKLGLKLAQSVDDAGFEFPFGDSEGSLIGAAKTKVHVSFGADGPAVFIEDSKVDTSVRNSVFGALQDKADGVVDDKVTGSLDGAENEHPFELFMVAAGTEGDPTDGDLTIADQQTNATVTWDGDTEQPLPVFLRQIDAHTIVGYVNAPDGEGTSEVAVFALYIDDQGCMSFYQIHQLNHAVDGPTFPDHDDPLFIKDLDGNPLIYVRATDYDGDHAVKAVTLEIQDDGPRFCEVDWGYGDSKHGVGLIDEDRLPNGNYSGPGDDKGGTHADGTVIFNFGADRPGTLGIQALTIKDSANNKVLEIGVDGDGNPVVVGANSLQAIDGQPIVIQKSGPNSEGIVVWTAFIDLGEGGVGDKVFTFSLDTQGDDIGDFDFCLHQPLEHPFQDANSKNDGPEKSFEDNFKLDFTVRGFDADGDWADGHVKINVDDDSPEVCGVTHGCVDEACFEKTGECVSIDAGDLNVNFAGTTATNGAILITGFGATGGSNPEVVQNFDGKGLPGFGVTSNNDGGSGGRFDEINYTGDGSPFDTPGEAMSIALTDPAALAVCATVVLSEFYTDEGGVEAERGQYQLYRDGVPVSGWIAFVAETANNGADGSGLKTLSINGPSGGFDEIRFRAIIGSDDGDGGDSSDFNVKSVKFDLGAIEPECIVGEIKAKYGADGPGEITLIDANLPQIAVKGVPVVVTVSEDGHTATGKIGDQTIFTLTVDPETLEYKFEIFSPIDNDPNGQSLRFGYEIVDADGDKLCSQICITVKDEGKPSVGVEQATAQVDEDGLPAGIGDKASGDQATDPAHNLPNESFWRGQIILDGGCDGLKDIALSTLNNETGLLTLDNQNVDTIWDAATHTLTGYVEGTDPTQGTNKVFTITLDPTLDGSYVLQLLKPVKHDDGNQENDEGFVVQIKVTDNDGSEATGVMPVNIDDDIPTLCVEVKLSGSVQHDETSGRDTGEGDDDTNAAVPSYFVGIAGAGPIIGWAEDEEGDSAIGVDFDFGADGPGSLTRELTIAAPGTNSQVKTTDGKMIFLYEEANGVVVGRVGGGAGFDQPDPAGAVAFAIHMDSNDGDLQVAQFLSLHHGDTGSHDETLILPASVLQATVTITDKDNDTVTQSVDIGNLVRFDDDGPKARLKTVHDSTVQHDETAGVQNPGSGADMDQDPAAIPAELVVPAATLIGWAQSKNPVVLVDELSFGADEEGAHSEIALKVAFNGVNSGLEVIGGANIYLYQDGDVVKGLVGQGVGGNTPNPNGAVAFVVSFDPATGKLNVAQYLAIDHDDAGPSDSDHDDAESIANSALKVVLTVTDGDGDVATSSVDIGDRVVFDDDGPSVTLTQKEGAEIRLDESVGPSTPADTNGNDDDETDSVGADIGYAKVAGADLFTKVVNFGQDGPGGTDEVFSLVLNDNNSGLFDVKTGSEVLLSVSGGSIVGRVLDGGFKTVFTISVDPNTGEVTVVQHRALHHGDPADHDESDTPEIMDLNTVLLKVTVKDGDDDTDSATIDLGKLIKFEDDGPVALDDVDALVPAAGNTFEAKGNVITGANVTTPGVDDTGTDQPAVISKVTNHLAASITPDSNGENIAGKWGTLRMESDGDYTYDFDETNTGKVPSGSTEVFTYILKDKDGDTDPATLTITFGEATVQTSAVVNPQGLSALKEDVSTPIALTATPGAGDRITQIVLDDIPAGWTVNQGGITLSSGVLGAITLVGDTLTINVTGAAPGVAITANVPVTANADSDVDGDNLVVKATAVDGVVFATSSATFDVTVDAILDEYLNVSQSPVPSVLESGAAQPVSLNLTSAFATTPFANALAGGSDTDLSEVVNLTVTITVSGDAANLQFPAAIPGVTLLEGVPGTWTLTADTLGHLQTALSSLQALVPAGFDGTITGNVSVTTAEANTPQGAAGASGNEPDTSDNVYTDDTSFSITVNNSHNNSISGEICFAEDGVFNQYDQSLPQTQVLGSISYLSVVSLGVDEALTALTITGIPAGAGLTINGVAVTNGVPLTGPQLANWIGGMPIVVTPAPNKDNDFTLSFSGSTTDTSSSLVSPISGSVAVLVDAAADDPTGVSIDVISTSGDEEFGQSETGTAKINATFGDVADGSEAHTLTITAPAGFVFTGVADNDGLPGGAFSAFPSGTITVTVPAGVSSVSDLVLNVQAPANFVGTPVFQVTATATETASDGGCGPLDGDDPTNNVATQTASDEVTFHANELPIAYDDEVCGDEAAPKNVNLLLVFDNSGSMNDPSGIPGASKLAAAKTAAINLLNELAGTGGDVKVMLVTFNADATRQPTWLGLADAITAINAIPSSGGNTSYEDAILSAISGFNDTDNRGNPATHDGLVYFLSDGVPTVDGNGDHSITDGTLTAWDNLLENPTNNIEHVYAVGLGTGIPGGASNSNLLDVAKPDGDNNPANTVILVDDFNDLTGTLTGTVGTLISGNILDGSIENDPDGPTAGANNDADFQGDAPAHVSFFEYDHPTLNGLDIQATWDGTGNVEPGDVIGGTNKVVSGTKVSFDTEFGRMTFDFSNGKFDFVAGAVDGGEKEEHFNYKITDNNNDESNQAVLTICIEDKFVDLKPVTFDDVATGTEPGPKSVNLLMVFDNSGSMNDPSGIPGTSKLQAAKTAAINLLNTYAATGGDVKVMLVTFNSDSTRQNTWLDLAAAITAINAIPSTNGSTNYEEAILDAISGFNDTDNRGDFATHDNVVYFLSDGVPTVGGNEPDNDITNGTLTAWDNLLESPANQIDHVYAVGLGTGIPGGASNPNLLDVANPVNNAVNETPNTVILVDDFNDLSATLTATVGTPITGNILDGSNESDPDAPAANTPDFQGDGPAHLSFFEYDSATNDLDIKITWDGVGAVVVDGVANGKSTVINGKEVSFDTDNGRMTIDFADGDFKLVPGSISGGDKTEVFNYKITDSDGDVSNQSTLSVTIQNLPPVVTIGDTIVNEGGSANIQVNLSEPALAGGVTVNYQFQTKAGNTATAGVDYTVVTSSLFIPAGATFGLISVNAAADLAFDDNETYSVVITGVTAGYTLGDDTGLVTINDTTTLVAPSVPAEPNPSGWPTDTDDQDELGDNNNTFNGTGTNDDFIDGEGGDDTLTGNAGEDQLEGGDGTDTLSGGADNDLLQGENDNDTLKGGDGNDQLEGGSGVDHLFGDGDATPLVDGNDELFGGTGTDDLHGGAGNDYLFADDDSNLDTLFGDAGNDVLFVTAADLGNASSAIDGGAGTDILDLTGVDFNSATQSIGITNIEVLRFEGGGNDDFSLTAADVLTITGGTGTLFVWGGSGGGDNDNLTLKTGDAWSLVGDNVAGGDGRTYDVYQSGGKTLNVDTDVDVTIAP